MLLCNNFSGDGSKVSPKNGFNCNNCTFAVLLLHVSCSTTEDSIREERLMEKR